MDEAALAGFSKILWSYTQEWKTEEYGFLVISVNHDVVRQLGHEAWIEPGEWYYYTEPQTDHKSDSIDQEITKQLAQMARALCHTHRKPENFSSNDFRDFKKLRQLTKDKKLRFDIVFYLMDGSTQVRRSSDEEHFFSATS
jgi:hypothetical protein